VCKKIARSKNIGNRRININNKNDSKTGTPMAGIPATSATLFSAWGNLSTIATPSAAGTSSTTGTKQHWFYS
jgi:hypothetical protein